MVINNNITSNHWNTFIAVIIDIVIEKKQKKKNKKKKKKKKNANLLLVGMVSNAAKRSMVAF